MAIRCSDEHHEQSVEVTRQGNHLYLFGETTQETGRDLCAALHALEEEINQNLKEGGSPDPIHLHICSPGGDVYPAIAIVSVIRRSSVPIWTWVEGEAKSSAVLISISGHRRFIAPEAEMLIHQPFMSLSGKSQDLTDTTNSLQELEKRLLRLICSVANPEAAKEIRKMSRRETCFDANKALALGLVDEIL